jgi:hypothetical protein
MYTAASKAPLLIWKRHSGVYSQHQAHAKSVFEVLNKMQQQGVKGAWRSSTILPRNHRTERDYEIVQAAL